VSIFKAFKKVACVQRNTGNINDDLSIPTHSTALYTGYHTNDSFQEIFPNSAALTLPLAHQDRAVLVFGIFL